MRAFGNNSTRAQGMFYFGPMKRVEGSKPRLAQCCGGFTGKPEIMPDCGTNFRLADNSGTIGDNTTRTLG